MKIHILTIGDEILIGQTIDTNSAWMGQLLNAHGGYIEGITSVADEEQAIKTGLEFALRDADAVLMTGGLGPTKDDITKKTLADFFGVEMVFSEVAWQHIQSVFEQLKRPTTSAHYQQSYMPANALLLTNKMGTAPGMWFEYKSKIVVSMPGVPYEMKYLMEKEVLPKLKKTLQAEPIAHRTILTVGEGESRLAQRIEPFVSQLPTNVKIAYLPSLGQVKIRLTGKDNNIKHLERVLDTEKEKLVRTISECIYGYDEESLPQAVGQLLRQRNLSIATAESCTGGYLAHLLTSVEGSSAYYMGSVIAYANTVKQSQLQVSGTTLLEHGAVSEQTVCEMVQGALVRFETDIAIAISGIAGPTGGTTEKPVGTIWLAIGNAERTVARKINISKNRLKNIEYTGTYGLNLIRQFVLEMV